MAAVLWDFDTAREFDTVNHVPAHGGSIDGPGAVAAGGMVFISSGYPRNGGMPGQRPAGLRCRVMLTYRKVFHPGMGHRRVRQPNRLAGVPFEVSRRHGGIAQQRSQPDVARVDRPESLVLASFGRQAHRHRGVQERDSQVAGIAGLVSGPRIRSEAHRRALGAVFLEDSQIAVPRAVPCPSFFS